MTYNFRICFFCCFFQGYSERCDQHVEEHKQSTSRVHGANYEEMGKRKPSAIAVKLSGKEMIGTNT